MKRLLLILPICLISLTTFAQRIEGTAAFRQINSDSYVKLHFENDFFTHTDWYYSQGISSELVNPVFAKNPLNKILLRLDNASEGNKKYGIDLQVNAFTPTDIVKQEILINDRPFAATISVKSFLISNNFATRTRLSSGVVLGVIGPLALGKEIQTMIHRWIDNYLPLGWPNQIKNDVILNYNVNHEKLLFDFGNYLAVNTNVQVRIGTLSDKVQVGATIMAGKYTSPFIRSDKPNGKRFQLYAYSQPLFSFVAYDATMQGGMFNRNSPYTVNASEVARVTFENQTGIVLQLHKFHMEGFLCLLTKEFNAGRMHRWGGVKLGFEF